MNRTRFFRERTMSRNSAELRPQLKEAQATLGEALKEACAMDPSKANTGELIHIEELLAIANESAKKAISVRRRLKRDGLSRAEADAFRSSRTQSREFVDSSTQVKWTAIAVRPSASTTLAQPYQSGWLSFDSGEETRRLAPIPEDWTQRSDEELCRLCQVAKVAPRRTPKE
jgi:hypothetical protein